MEAAEAHAWQLDQLAHNLSRCRDALRTQPGPCQGSQGLKGSVGLAGPEASALPGGRAAQAGGPSSWDGGRPCAGLRLSGPHLHRLGRSRSPHSIIRGVNQDRFIQRAIEAADAYSSILRAVQAAEGAAGQALQQAGHTWTVSPALPSVPEPCPPAAVGWV